jgi:apolipoprotein N-acyltransferase
MSQREQIFANNNGLSSLINTQGEIIKQLPAWKTRRINVMMNTHHTKTLWMSWGDKPMIFLCFCILSFAFNTNDWMDHCPFLCIGCCAFEYSRN